MAAEGSAEQRPASAELQQHGAGVLTKRAQAEAQQPGAEVLTKRARAERIYGDLRATGAPVSAGQLAAAAGLSASYARALVAQFRTRPPAAVEQNGRRPVSVAADEDPEVTS